MDKPTLQFNDFLNEVNPAYKDFVSAAHEKLTNDGYKSKIENKASGFFISYAHPKTKRSILNFLFRKKGMFARVYADGCTVYGEFLSVMPESMEKEITKAGVCKRLINPDDCNPKCVMGYDFNVRDNHYQKCRYSCFQFEVKPDSVPYIAEFIENERKSR